jgi:hypothetical protein
VHHLGAGGAGQSRELLEGIFLGRGRAEADEDGLFLAFGEGTDFKNRRVPPVQVS